MSIHHLIALSVLGVGLTLSPAAMAQNKQSAYKALEEANPPKFVPPDFWVEPILRIGVGLGGYTLTNDSAATTNLGGFGLSVWGHFGEKFFDFIGYYINLRATNLSFSEIESNGQVFSNYKSKQAANLDAGLGLELWVIPEWVSLSAEGSYQYLLIEAQPTNRNDYTLERSLTGAVGRARAAIHLGPLSIHGEYSKWLPMSDSNDNSSWEGWQAMFNLSYDYGEHPND